ncbi:MAG: hypothetical protein QW568_00615 [Candidatus Anstonellaceae archaeon]
MRKKAFLASFEAASAILLLIVAASALQLYQFQKTFPQEFFLCSDAAVLISKSGDFSRDSLLAQAQEISELSDMCISIQIAGEELFSPCGKENGRVFAFTLPVWREGLQELQVRCEWQSQNH